MQDAVEEQRFLTDIAARALLILTARYTWLCSTLRESPNIFEMQSSLRVVSFTNEVFLQ